MIRFRIQYPNRWRKKQCLNLNLGSWKFKLNIIIVYSSVPGFVLRLIVVVVVVVVVFLIIYYYYQRSAGRLICSYIAQYFPRTVRRLRSRQRRPRCFCTANECECAGACEWRMRIINIIIQDDLFYLNDYVHLHIPQVNFVVFEKRMTKLLFFFYFTFIWLTQSIYKLGV